MEKFLICIQTSPADKASLDNRHSSMEAAVAYATKMLQDNPKFTSVTICTSTMIVERSTPPVNVRSVIDYSYSQEKPQTAAARLSA
jgi:hypothetical protein